MHWIVNTCLKREGGYEALIEQLNRQGVEYTLVRKPPFAEYLVAMHDEYDDEGQNKPIMLDIEGPVFVTGTTSMHAVSKAHGWSPGYIDSPCIRECIEHWGEYMLNHDSIFGAISEITPVDDDFFIRPNVDSKSFAGTIMTKVNFESWRDSLLAIDSWTTIPADTEVIMCSVKKIWAEYRCSVVNGRVVTASRYKTGATVAYSNDVGSNVYDYANQRVQEWNPRIAFTLDIADTPDGFKIIETNAISSSGFYALDMNKFVGEITALGDL